MSIQIAELHTEHCTVDVNTSLLGDYASLDKATLYTVVSEKHGEDNSGYLVADLGEAYWCACDDFRFNRVEDNEIVDECKHIEAVKKRTREAVEDDQNALDQWGDVDV